MTDIVCTCATALDMTPIPNDCGANDYGFPYLLVFMKTTGTCFTGCDYPTVADIQARQALSNDSKMIVVGPITNGQRTESDKATESGADTIDGLENVVSQIMGVQGKLKFLDEDTRTALENLNCHKRLKMWIVTNTGWIFGGSCGYNVANFISSLIQEGYGTRSYIPISYKWDAKDKNDPAGYDTDYTTLVNT